jgi:hypothetical protein
VWTSLPITHYGTREEPGTLTQGEALFSLVPLVWESNPKLQGGWCKANHQPSGHLEPTQGGAGTREEPCTLNVTGWSPVFPSSGDLIPTIWRPVFPGSYSVFMAKSMCVVNYPLTYVVICLLGQPILSRHLIYLLLRYDRRKQKIQKMYTKTKKKPQKKCNKMHKNTQNAKNDISGITDILTGFSPYWLSPITSFHHIGDNRYYRDILESVTPETFTFPKRPYWTQGVEFNLRHFSTIWFCGKLHL